jgi:hypothetical protein
MCSFEAALRCITVYPVHSIWAALSTMESIREEVAHMQVGAQEEATPQEPYSLCVEIQKAVSINI